MRPVTRSSRSALSGLVLVGSLLLPLSAQERPLTIEAIYGGELSTPSPQQIRWTPHGDLSYFLSAEEGRDLWLYEVDSGERRVLVGAEELRDLAPSPSQAAIDERERTRRTRYGIPAYHWTPDGESILFVSSGQIFLYRLQTEEATRLAPSKSGVLDPKPSPDGRWVAFVYDHDLWVVPADGGSEKRITFGGSEVLLHGELDWVYPEELGIRSGYEWSPDSRHIAFLELDESPVPTHPILDVISRQATVDHQRYPKAGDPNPGARVGIVDVEKGRTVWVERTAEYVPRFQWVTSETLSLQLLDRGQEELELLYADPVNGRSRSILTERDAHWINVTDDLTFLDGGTRLVWSSERSGFRHLYLYEVEEKGAATLLRALTSGDWQVAGVEGVDEEGGWVYFSGNRDHPIGSDLYRVRLDGSGLERLSEGEGTHRIQLAPEADAYLDRFSSLTDPGRTTYRELGSGRVETFHEELSLEEYGLVEPEWKLLDTPDGATISVLLLEPPDLAPGTKAPVVVYVYGMPGFPAIRDAWGGRRYLFHQFLVERGYLVAYLDDRTSARWGHRYAVAGEQAIGPVAVRDHEIAVKYLRSLPRVDDERLAIWGWSGGGFTTTFHMTHTDLFRVGVAGAPVTDWRLYDTIYTERYMGTPEENPEAYERTSSVAAAADYRGRLLLIHGTHDDNVHPQNTLKLADALIENGKQFDLMLYPNETHSISGRAETIHLWTYVYEYLERHLVGSPPG